MQACDTRDAKRAIVWGTGRGWREGRSVTHEVYLVLRDVRSETLGQAIATGREWCQGTARPDPSYGILAVQWEVHLREAGIDAQGFLIPVAGQIEVSGEGGIDPTRNERLQHWLDRAAVIAARYGLHLLSSQEMAALSMTDATEAGDARSV